MPAAGGRSLGPQTRSPNNSAWAGSPGLVPGVGFSENLDSGIRPHAVGIVGILVARHDRVEALTEERQGGVLYALVGTRVRQASSQIARESMPLMESAQGPQTRVATDLPTGKIRTDGSVSVEREGQL